jgi:hypothetical protein
MIYVMLRFDEEKAKKTLEFETCEKLVIFDENDEYRKDFERLYIVYGDRITFYEGNVELNFAAYLKRRTHEYIALVPSTTR